MDRKLYFETRITIVYLVVGILWILLSDYLARFILPDVKSLSQFQSLKGIVFVTLSSILIYLLTQHYRHQQQEMNRRLMEAKLKAEESEKLKSAFLNNLSHEVRTPMNGIIGFINLLEDPTSYEDRHVSFHNYIKISSERLLETLYDIIEISQIESSQLVVCSKVFDPVHLICELCEKHRSDAEVKGLKLEINLERMKDELHVETDESMFGSIVEKLLKNAIKFSHQGKIEVGMVQEADQFTVKIKDNGIGIPEDLQELIFDRFTQVDDTLSRNYEGTGLGLAIAKAYALHLGGEIGLDSEEGEGSTFWFSLPLKA